MISLDLTADELEHLTEALEAACESLEEPEAPNLTREEYEQLLDKLTAAAPK